MQAYRHHVSGFFAKREEAHRALSTLIARGLPRSRLHIFDNQSGLPADTSQAGSDEVLKDVLVDGAIGATVGTGLGALAGVALVAANVSLFIASPLIAPLAILGWGASLGGFLGAATGAGNANRPFSDLIKDAIANGQVVLLVETRTEQETSIAREILQASVGTYEDISVAPSVTVQQD
jgi:MFS superfamily sulfate permease-like transporter